MIHQSPLYPSGTRGIPASSVSNPAVATARFSDGEKRQIVSRLGFAPHDTQSVFQARHRKRAPGAFSPCFPTGFTTLSELNPPRVNSDFLFPRHKAAVLRLFKGRTEPSEPERNRHLFAFSPQQSLCGIEHIGGLCLVKAKTPTVTGYGVSRGIGLSVGSGSPLLFGDMLCKTKLKSAKQN